MNIDYFFRTARLAFVTCWRILSRKPSFTLRTSRLK
jgi:hypothetical protein